jgi:hypothetical protein
MLIRVLIRGLRVVGMIVGSIVIATVIMVLVELSGVNLVRMAE